MEKNFKEVTAQGYEISAMVHTGFAFARHDGKVKEYDVICKRNCDFEPYIVCLSYDITDGTWGCGSYWDTYDQAIARLKEHM